MKILTCALLSAALLGGPAFAEHWHEDHDHWKRHWEHRDDDDRDYNHHAENCYFEPREVRVLSEYYAPRGRDLPPGLRKKFYRTGHLPPGWERRMEPIPVAVERQLEPLPDGYRRGFIDGNVVIYSPRTQVVIDVMAVFGR